MEVKNTDTTQDNVSDETPAQPPVIRLPLDDEQLANLRAGSWVSLEGAIYVIGTRAATKLLALLDEEQPLPFDLQDQLIFHATSTPAPWGKVSGSIGPNLAQSFATLDNLLLQHGARGILARGPIEGEPLTLLKQQRGIYLVTPSSASALLARTIHQSDVVAFEELGVDAIRRIKVSSFPAILAIDSFGRNIFKPQITPEPETTQEAEELDG